VGDEIFLKILGIPPGLLAKTTSDGCVLSSVEISNCQNGFSTLHDLSIPLAIEVKLLT
jgi:hypothetical protein